MDGRSRRAPLPSAFLAQVAVVACLQVAALCCRPVSRQLEIHTGELTCEEANRFVYDALLGMKMTVTGLKLAKPGGSGYVRAERNDESGRMRGTVHISCGTDGVRISTDEEGIASDKRMTRGVYLSVTGRAGLHKPAPVTSPPVAKGPTASAAGAGAESASGSAHGAPSRAPGPSGGLVRERVVERPEAGVSVRLAPVRGFASVLDFDADLSAAGILPIQVTLRNGTRRTYEFDPADIVLRKAGTRLRSKPLGPTGAIDRLREANRSRLLAESGSEPADPMAASQLGDVAAAARTIRSRRLRAARLSPGQQLSGFLYYPLDDYDRARIVMIDVATGETEGFLVEF